ncbi:MAG: hypothetical protein LBE13_01225 [Bacteroidales bacterium]|jgi:hypothetical protein|nr:hypothetical protein [Bacteroidales bacterium]
MKRGEIIISEKKITIVPANGTVWLSDWQIAQLFEVYQVKINSNIRSILKSGVLRAEDVYYCYHYENGNCVDLYNLEMITALAFRIHSPKADLFRKWVMKQAVKQPPVFIGWGNEQMISLN